MSEVLVLRDSTFMPKHNSPDNLHSSWSDVSQKFGGQTVSTATESTSSDSPLAGQAKKGGLSAAQQYAKQLTFNPQLDYYYLDKLAPMDYNQMGLLLKEQLYRNQQAASMKRKRQGSENLGTNDRGFHLLDRSNSSSGFDCDEFDGDGFDASGLVSQHSLNGGSKGGKGRGDNDDDIMFSSLKRNALSHSTIEKHRRDKMNAIIDELAELVPPMDSKYRSDGVAAGVARRPKHVVLADVLRLVREVQRKVAEAAAMSAGAASSAVHMLAQSSMTGRSRSAPDGCVPPLLEALACTAIESQGMGLSGGGGKGAGGMYHGGNNTNNNANNVAGNKGSNFHNFSNGGNGNAALAGQNNLTSAAVAMLGSSTAASLMSQSSQSLSCATSSGPLETVVPADDGHQVDSSPASGIRIKENCKQASFRLPTDDAVQAAINTAVPAAGGSGGCVLPNGYLKHSVTHQLASLQPGRATAAVAMMTATAGTTTAHNNVNSLLKGPAASVFAQQSIAAAVAAASAPTLNFPTGWGGHHPSDSSIAAALLSGHAAVGEMLSPVSSDPTVHGGVNVRQLHSALSFEHQGNYAGVGLKTENMPLPGDTAAVLGGGPPDPEYQLRMAVTEVQVAPKTTPGQWTVSIACPDRPNVLQEVCAMLLRECHLRFVGSSSSQVFALRSSAMQMLRVQLHVVAEDAAGLSMTVGHIRCAVQDAIWGRASSPPPNRIGRK